MRALVALGSNLGDRRASLEAGLAALAGLGAVTPSPLWPETPDMTGLGPGLPEHRGPAGDRRARIPGPCWRPCCGPNCAWAGTAPRGRNAPRTLDLDLIAVEGLEGSWRWPAPADLAVLGAELTLELPHPRARLRPFVMEPARALGVGFF